MNRYDARAMEKSSTQESKEMWRAGASVILLKRILRHTNLMMDEQKALLSLAAGEFAVGSHDEIVRDGQSVDSYCLLADGVLARTLDTASGSRQITALYVPGEIPDIHTLIMPSATVSLEAIGNAHIVRIHRATMHDAIRRFPILLEAFWREAAIDAIIALEWIANIGQRPALSRIAHLFAEIAVRMDVVRGNAFHFSFPPTQIQIAQAVGLSSVHVNRSLNALREENVLQLRNGIVFVEDWAKLKHVAEFDDNYLSYHEPQRIVL
jgi:CRP-like cAMP-binding protein